MAKDRAKLDRSRDFSEVTGPGLFYHFGQDGKYFGADEVEIFPSEILDAEQAAVPDAAAKALEAGKAFLARAKAEADRFKDRAAAAEAANVTKDAEIADLKAQLAAGQTVDVAALQEKLAEVTLAGADVAGKLAEAISANLALQAEASDKDRELRESSDALARANATIAELQALLEPAAEPPAAPVATVPDGPPPSGPDPSAPDGGLPSEAPAAPIAAPGADAPAEASVPADAPVDAAPVDAPADRPPA